MNVQPYNKCMLAFSVLLGQMDIGGSTWLFIMMVFYARASIEVLLGMAFCHLILWQGPMQRLLA